MDEKKPTLSGKHVPWVPQYEGGSCRLERLSICQDLLQRAQTYKHGFGDNEFLCVICKSIFTGRRQERETKGPAVCEIEQTIADLKIAANDGCQLCWLRWQQVRRLDRSKLSLDRKIKYGFLRARTPLDLAFDYPHLQPGQQTTLSVLLTAAPPSDLTPSLAIGGRAHNRGIDLESPNLNKLHSSTNSFSTLKMVTLWMNTCLASHTQCKEYEAPNRRLPTRLVDLDESDEIRPKICASQRVDCQSRYASLSHCWGGTVPARLLGSNIKAYHERLPVEDLPNTFKHAMEISKRLGLRYIWIDSLCIIQDDEADWHREAAHMGDVYKFAVINIAATHANNGVEGCFRSRSLMELEPCTARAAWDGLPKTLYYCHDFRRSEYELDLGPLLKRAWVVQEIALASRVIHYTSAQVYWECAQLRACETFPDGLPESANVKLGVTVPAVHSNILGWSASPRPPWQRFHIWKELVNRYTAADLTFRAKDKLVAISGPARELGSAVEYAAGLWMPDLADELQWFARTWEGPKPSRSRDCRAPSWSWASIDGPIYARNHFIGKQSQAVEFLDVYVQPLNDDRFGQIKTAYIRLKGCLVCGKAGFRSRVITTRPRTLGGKLVEVPWTNPDWYGHYLENTHCDIYLDEGEIEDGDVVYCLPLKMEESSNCGILLSPTPIRGQFTRSGYFVIRNGHEDFRSYCKRSPIPIDDNSGLYERRAENTAEGYAQYVIRLV